MLLVRKFLFSLFNNYTDASYLAVASWKHEYCAEMLTSVHDKCFGARLPSYALIQQLDKRLRSISIPTPLRIPGLDGVETDERTGWQSSPRVILQSTLAKAHPQISTLFILPKKSRQL